MSRPHARAIQQLSNTVQNTERAVGEARNTLTFISRSFTPLAPACSNFNVAIKLVKDELSNNMMNSFNQQYGKLEALLEKRRKTKCLWHSSFKPGSAWKPTKCSRPSYFFLLFTFLNLLAISTSLYHFISRFYHVSSATLVGREMGSEMQPDYVRARQSAQDFKNRGSQSPRTSCTGINAECWYRQSWWPGHKRRFGSISWTRDLGRDPTFLCHNIYLSESFSSRWTQAAKVCSASP